MTSNRPAGRPAKNTVPPTSRRSARQQRLANREANRSMTRAGTSGSSGPGRNSLMLWSLGFVVVAVVVVAALALATQSKTTSIVPAPHAPVVVTPTTIPSNGQTLGDPAAKVTVDLYGDFRCSACFDFTTQGTEKSLIDNYIANGKAKLVWHDLLSIDKDGTNASRDAANAALCGADQGKFWTMHDWLYANQSPSEAASWFTAARLSQIAQLAGLDMTKFQPCFDAGTHNAAIAAEQTNIPRDAGGTPSVFVNGKYVGVVGSNTVPSYNDIKVAIDGALGLPTPTPSASTSASASASGSATASASASASSSASAS